MDKSIQEELDKLEAEKKAMEEQSEINKKLFIDEIKNGLGKQIMENPNGVEKIEKPKLWDRIRGFLKNL